jgi:hypothetical protein
MFDRKDFRIIKINKILNPANPVHPEILSKNDL